MMMILIKCKFCKKDLLVKNLVQKHHPECTSNGRKQHYTSTTLMAECHMCHTPIPRLGGRSRYCKECAKKRVITQKKRWSKNNK